MLRDSLGTFVAARQIPWKGNLQAKEAEAIGVREALKWIKNLNLEMVQVEMDAQLVFQSLKSQNPISSFDLIINDINGLARGYNLSFLFAKRSANIAAHKLARNALFKSDCIEYFSFPPSVIADVLIMDCS